MRNWRDITGPLKRSAAALCLIICLTTPCSLEISRAEGYRAKEVGRHIELTTPQGSRVLFGDFSFDTARDYKISIPLKDLQPVPPPAPGTDAAESGSPPAVPPVPSPRDPQSLLPALPGDPAPVTASEPEKKTPPRLQNSSDYDDTEKLVVGANHFFNKGKFFEATMYVEELVRKKPDYVRGWVMKGSLLYVQGHKDLAKKAWEQAKALDPQNQEVKDIFQRYKLP